MEGHDHHKEFLAAYEQFADAIFRHCFFRTSDRELALDLSQETFTRAWTYIAEGGEVENMRAFLYRVANNLVVDGFRKKKTSSLDKLQEEGFDPADTSIASAGISLDVRQALGVLEAIDPSYREVVTLRYIDDLSIAEIAELLQQSENVISVRIHRGLKKARELLEAEAEHAKLPNIHGHTP